MTRSAYPIPTRKRTSYVANDGSEFDSEAKTRQHNAVLAINEICEDEGGWQGVVTASDVARFIISNMSAIAPWADDLNG